MDKKMTSKMRELAQLAKEKNRVLPVTEAFKLYPVEEEEHKGKLEYWQKQENLV